ncbi:MAG: universal stress protein [Deltaproteobacteria bacterium]|jgi:nucleotide-binding universal stress UspA family protein
MEELTKKIVIPIDGSKNALRSFDYLKKMYGPKHKMDLSLLYVVPSLPPLLGGEKLTDKEVYASLTNAEQRLLNKANKVLNQAKQQLLAKGFEEKRIEMIAEKRRAGVGQNICEWAENERVDAVLLTRRGQTDLEMFFLGRVSDHVVGYCKDAPVWVMGGVSESKKVLVCVDNSENALRAVDHAGFMLGGTDAPVTVFHTMRHLKRYIPEDVLEETPELEELWKKKAGEDIAPFMEKARDMLLKAGLAQSQVTSKIVEGSRSPADDILKEARENGYGTIVLGRRGISGIKGFLFGSVTKKILNQATGLTIWLVQ